MQGPSLSVGVVTVAMAAALGCGGPDAPADSGGGLVDASGLDASGLDASGLDASGRDAGTPTGARIPASEGGFATSADGLFEIYVFPGALAEDTTITITRLAEADVPAEVTATAPISGVYSVEPDGLTFAGDGAVVHYHFATTPSGLVEAGAIELRGGAFALARPATGGALDVHADPQTIHRETGAMDLYASLRHLSLQWAVRRDPASDAVLWVGADFGAHSHEVGQEWSGTTVVRASLPARATIGSFTTYDVVVPLLRPGLELLSEPWRDPADPRALDEGVGRVADALVADEDHLQDPSPRWRCARAGRDRLMAVGGFFTGAASLGLVVLVDREETRCSEPSPVEVSILDTIHGEREAALVSIGFEPRLDARVERRPATTRTVPVPMAGGEPSSWFATLSPAGDPLAAGPGPITATNSGATMTATPDPGTGVYEAIVDDPAVWQTEAPTRFTIGGVVTDLMPPAAPAVTFGPVDGLDTLILPDAPDAELDLRIRFPGTTSCMGSDVEDLVVFRHLDGTVASVPLREGVELAAALCGRTAAELTARDFYVDVGTRSSEVVDLGSTSVRVTTRRTFELDGRDLVATCAAGRTYCTDACVDTASDPAHCGGCGLAPAEICDGIDNDCDGRADSGCPARLEMQAAGFLQQSPWFGSTTGGDSENSFYCSSQFQVLDGLCGAVNSAGNLARLGPHCATIGLGIDRSATPYRYSVALAPQPPCGSTTGAPTTGGVFSQYCPPGMLVEAVSAAAGTEVGQVQIRCVRWEVVETATGWVLRRDDASAMTLPVNGTGAGSLMEWAPSASAGGVPAAVQGLRHAWELSFDGDVVRARFAGNSATFRTHP